MTNNFDRACGKSDNAPIIKLWLFFFFYVVSVSCLIQLVILPYMVPAWHAGDGLVVSSLDSIYLHKLAVKKAQIIHDKGWYAWELRPNNQSPAGIASIFYYLVTPKIWTLIPLNAALHATAAIVLLRIVQFFMPEWRKALLAVLPFFFFLTPIAWYAQLHRDGYSILGFYLIIYAWCVVAQYTQYNESSIYKRKLLLKSSFHMVSGLFLIWIARPYLIQMILVSSIVIASIFTVHFLIRWKVNIITFRQLIRGVLIAWSLIIIIYPFTRLPLAETVTKIGSNNLENSLIQNNLIQSTIGKGEVIQEILIPDIWRWHRTSWLSPRIDNKFYSLSHVRAGLLSLRGKSDIDRNVIFLSAPEILRYIPRALQIVFFAPFPHHWIGEGTYESTTLMRRVVMPEMLLVYLSLAFIPYVLVKWYRQIELWIVLIPCIFIMLIYGIVFPNIGSIHRMRYGYIMAIVAVGIAGMLTFFDKHLKQRKMQ